MELLASEVHVEIASSLCTVLPRGHGWPSRGGVNWFRAIGYAS
jgi:hypothetical protein